MKRGAVSLLVTLLALLLAAAILFALHIEQLKRMDRFSKDQICELSVFGRATTAKRTGGTETLVGLDCETYKVKMTGEGILLNNKPLDKTMNYKRLSDPDAQTRMNGAIAEEMRSCWYRFLEGNLDPFERFGGNSRCVMCSTIAFDDEVSRQVPTLDGLNDYLTDNKIPSGGVTYLQYLTKGATAWSGPPVSIDTSKTYGIVYISDKKDGTKWGVTWGAAACAGWLLAGIPTSGAAWIGAVGVCGSAVGLGLAGEGVMSSKGAWKVHTDAKQLYVALMPLSELGTSCKRFD